MNLRFSDCERDITIEFPQVIAGDRLRLAHRFRVGKYLAHFGLLPLSACAKLRTSNQPLQLLKKSPRDALQATVCKQLEF